MVRRFRMMAAAAREQLMESPPRLLKLCVSNVMLRSADGAVAVRDKDTTRKASLRQIRRLHRLVKVSDETIRLTPAESGQCRPCSMPKFNGSFVELNGKHQYASDLETARNVDGRCCGLLRIARRFVAG